MNKVDSHWAVSLHPDRLNVYSVSPGRHLSVPDPDLDDISALPVPTVRPDGLKNNKHRADLSPRARSRLELSIVYLMAISKKLNHKINFVTLTLSSKQIHPDHEITRIILQPFLLHLRRRFKITAYVWRAEVQSTGNVHFHLLTDCFIPWNDLRNMWNYYQNKLGYVDRYRSNQKLWHRDGFRYRPELAAKWPLDKQLTAYRQGLRTDWNSPNSTDVHWLHRIGNIKAYLTKYLTKVDERRPVTCNHWGCSEELEGIKGGRASQYIRLQEEIEKLEHTPGVWHVHDQYYDVYRFVPGTINERDFPELFEILQTFLITTFPKIYHPEFTAAYAA